MIPRVLCIGGKEGEPNDTSGEFITGKILTVGTIVQFGLQVFAASELLLTEMCTKYPHLFNPLPWWYGRTVDEMPEYVKWNHKGERGEPELTVNKVTDWFMEDGTWRWIGLNDECGNFVFWNDESQYQPADESEYQEYQKQKQ